MKLLLYRVYQIVIMLPVLLVATILTALLTLIGCSLGGGAWWGYWPAHIWSKLFCVMTMVRVHVVGRENISSEEGYVFVANHQGAYDIFSIYGYLGHDFRWMMKSGLKKIPLVGAACKAAGQIYVDNSTPSRLRSTMADAERQLRGGKSLVVFPEGSRSRDGHLHAFRRGAYILASEFKLPVVPVSIDGSYAIMTREAKLPHWGTITLRIHPAIYPDDTDGHDTETLMKQTRDIIARDLGEC